MRAFGFTQKGRNRHASRVAVVAALVLLIPATGASPAQTFTRLAGHIPSGMDRALDLGHLEGSTRISLALPIKPRDPAGLQALVQRLYDPGDPLYHQFLTTQQFTERYAATTDTVAEITQSLTNMGLTVTSVHPNRGLVKFEGSAADIERAFQTELHAYQTASGHSAYAPIQEPLVSERLAAQINMIAGLNNVMLAHPNFQQRAQNTQDIEHSEQVYANPVGGLTPVAIRKAYNLASASQTGTGEVLGLYELDGYTAGDIAAYTSEYSLQTPTLTNVLVDGATGVPSSTGPTSPANEVTMDIEMMIALAPGASKIMVYEGPNSGNSSDYLDLLNRIANDNLAKEISSSWAFAEATANTDAPGFLQSENTTFQQMAAQGQTFFAAAGDSGSKNDSGVVGVEDPASQPYVTGVGGTTLSTGAGGVYGNEVVWNNSYGGGGGGNSGVWATPTWQANLATQANGGAANFRTVPDVALNADPNTGYAYYFGSQEWGIIGGTSAAAPLWAAFTALLNQERVAGGLPRLGFLNSTLYQLAEGSLAAQSLHDITSGNNGSYYAVTGYDLASGWGSFNGAGLLQALGSSGLPPATPFNFKVQAVNP